MKTKEISASVGELKHSLALVGRPVWVVEEQANPSTDNYVWPALIAYGLHPVHRSFEDVPGDEALLGTTIVFVRYVPARWRQAVSRLRDRLADVIYFMDDDLLDTTATSGLSLRYRWKLWSLAARHYRWLIANGATVWVSTASLEQKYKSLAPTLLLPAGISEQPGARRIFYHGTASHFAEKVWLKQVVRAVLDEAPQACFEIVGTRDVQELYADVPRVAVVHPMKWPSYLAFVSSGDRHIGLAPMIDSAFNRTRSYTRVLDHTRCGAVGVYSEGSASAAVITNRHDGVVLPMRPQAWVDGILELLSDDPWRISMVRNAQATAASLRAKAFAGYAELGFVAKSQAASDPLGDAKLDIK